MRNSVLTVLAAALFAAGCSVDATQFTCHASTECPTGYHCDMSAQKCASGAPTGNPVLSSFAWDKTLIQPADHATITFTVSEPIEAAGFPPEVAAHGITLGALTAVTTGAAATYTMAVTMPAACDGAGNNPVDDAAIPLSLAFTASGNRTGSGPIGSVTCTVAKTLGVTASKIRLVKQPYPDGSVRTAVAADRGAITATPGLAGVSLVVTSGGTVIGSSAANSDGSSALLELPGAPTQVTLTVADRTGRSVAVTGYSQRVVMSLSGKDVTGNANPLTVYDVGSVSNSVYPPQSWVQSGTGPDGGTITELQPSYVTLPDGGVTQLNSYGAFAYEESVRGNSVVPLTPDQDGGTPLGWEPIATGSTVATPAVIPPARHSAAIFRGFFGFTAGTLSFSVPLVGGLDGSNAFVDAPGTFYGINPNGGGLAGLVTPPQSAPFTTQPAPYRTLFWQANEPTTAGAFIGVDSPAGRAGVALGPGTSNNTCTGACTDYSDYLNIFLLAGGNTTNATTGTNRIYAFGTRTHNTPGGSRQYLGWWDVSQETGVLLPFNNYNMSFAPSPGFTNSLPTTLGGGGQFTPGMMLVGGALNTQFTNDANGCLTVAALYQNPNPPQYQVASCTDANWTTTSGQIGLRSGAAIVASDNGDGTFFLFGGTQTASTSGFNGTKNDLWRGTLSVAAAVRTVSWAPVSTTGALPPARSGAALVFGDSRRLLLYGGNSAAGTALTDLWELDLNVTPSVWRQVATDPAPALAPAARARFSALGQPLVVYGGVSGGTALNDMWQMSKTAPGRLLIKAPTGITNPGAVSNLTMNVTVTGGATSLANLYAWDGTTWRFLARPSTTITVVSVQNPASYLQPDGSVSLMFMPPVGNRNRPAVPVASNTVSFDSLSVALDFQ